ncbi:MAG TPA: hypothetical protein VG538_13280 [Vicinamibacterales bacterium]|jgi:hypothetical protein|nr:hypothetical protein [Vicinamibacterales bacterium]
MSRTRSAKANNFSPTLTWLIEAAGQAKADADGAHIGGAARALAEFGALARWVVPTRGVFVPNDGEIAMAIERIAKQHLELERARKAFREALNVVEPFEPRDAIASAQNLVQTVSDEAYFYAGLAIGVTLVDLL